MRALSPRPVRIACSTQTRFSTGSMPGSAASTSDTWLFGSAPKAVEAPEKSLEWEITWACTSRPITTSQVPLSLSIRLIARCSSAS